MLLNPYYRLLNFPNCFDQDKLEQELSDGQVSFENGHWKKPEWVGRTTVLSEDFHVWLWETFKCTVINIEVFYTAPLWGRGWHLDMNPPSDFVKINYAWGDPLKSEMQWGQSNTVKELITSSTTAGTQYVGYKDDEVVLDKTISFNKPALVNVGRPHRIINYSNYGRWCLCIVPGFNGKRILFPDAVNIFSEYVLD